MMRERSRRTLLGGAAAAVTGLLGAGIFGRRAEAPTASPPPSAEATTAQSATSTVELRLYGRGWQFQADGPRASWVRPVRGQQSLVYGELLDAPALENGAKVGELYATCTCVNAPFGPGPLAASFLEQHTLNLQDGTLLASGTSQGDDGTFAIVGGTGRYTGARGSYLARQAPLGRGGDGTAELTITLILDDEHADVSGGAV